MKDINTLEELAKKYTTKKLAMEFLMHASRINSEVGTPDTQGNIKRNIKSGFDRLSITLEKIIAQQQGLTEELNKLKLEVTIQKPEITRFKAFINTISGAVIAILVSAIMFYFTRSVKKEPVIGRKTATEVKIEVEEELIK